MKEQGQQKDVKELVVLAEDPLERTVCFPDEHRWGASTDINTQPSHEGIYMHFVRTKVYPSLKSALQGGQEAEGVPLFYFKASA